MQRFAGHLAHEGIWEGTYRHFSAEGVCEDQLTSRVVCAFPRESDVFYRQSIILSWADGRVHQASFDGHDRGDHLFYDTPTFTGRSWEAGDGVLMLNLLRKDEPGAYFVEVIIMAPSGKSRARTWHWFRHDGLYRRTLCDEVRVG
jgi:hypothetical protein